MTVEVIDRASALLERQFSAEVLPVVLDRYFEQTPTIELNAGVTFCDDEFSLRHNYIAHVPIPDESSWRKDSIEKYHGREFDLIRNIYCRVGVFALPTPLLEVIKRLNGISDQEGDYIGVTRAIARYLVPRFGLIPSTFIEHPIVTHEPGLISTTIDSKTSKRPGLHLDSWSEAESEGRFASKIRFNVNLGPGDRAFTFASKGLSQLDAPIAPDAYYQFLRTYPGTPIFRITLKPGTGYIAATECVIHDGTTSVAQALGAMSYQVRARVAPRVSDIRF